MGLISLKEKIDNKLKKPDYSEEDVLYLLVEIRKYLERSKKHLGDEDMMKINDNNFPAIGFFRNWACHTKIDRPIPEKVASILNTISESENVAAESSLFQLLHDEINGFSESIGSTCSIEWSSFDVHLKNIISEQPLEIKAEKLKHIGYGNPPGTLFVKEIDS